MSEAIAESAATILRNAKWAFSAAGVAIIVLFPLTKLGVVNLGFHADLRSLGLLLLLSSWVTIPTASSYEPESARGLLVALRLLGMVGGIVFVLFG